MQPQSTNPKIKPSENYRPISISPIINKCFEKEVFRQVYSYLTDNNLLSKYQSGFRPKHSKLSTLIQMCNDWLNNMDKGKINCVVFLDIRKAFDSDNHESWLDSYLKDTEQQCVVNGKISYPKKIICGVPQGSILGHFYLFIIYK